ncbi:hypothetical protein E3T28_10320 [Cryobacterium sinapicolor]|uniref:Uncharacterized protein n=1 Tax=Cryobacterium sinapicolor TaxID=1259236 RepID=A0ABY2J523_9MICO|nr:hypothetical protein E3T28_10320 [Cryobacterium sinapicolor]
MVAAITGFASSFVLVIAGLQAVGATDDQAASGLLALCLLVGITCVMLPWYFKMPISFAWSTPRGGASRGRRADHGRLRRRRRRIPGLRCSDRALWTLDSGLWTLDSGRRWGGPSPSAVW